MKNIIYLLLTSLLIIGCNPLNKSITEELDIKELSKAVNKDTTFASIYKVVEEFKSLNSDKLKLAEFSELTYQDVFDYYKFDKDTLFWKPIFEDTKEKYESEFGKTRNKGLKFIDSLKNKEKEWIQANSPESFVDIKLVGLTKEYYSYSGGIRDVYFRFQLTSKKGTIQQVVWSIDPTAKINRKKKSSSYLDLSFNRQRYIYSSPFKQKATGRYEASYTHRDLAKNKSLKTFLRDYDLNLKVVRVRHNNQNYSESDFKFPDYVDNYMNEERLFMKDYYLTEIINENIDSSYIDYNDFRHKIFDSIIKKKYPLEHKFNQYYLKLKFKNFDK